MPRHAKHDDIARMYRAGSTYDDIRDGLGVGYHTIRSVLKLEGITPHPFGRRAVPKLQFENATFFELYRDQKGDCWCCTLPLPRRGEAKAISGPQDRTAFALVCDHCHKIIATINWNVTVMDTLTAYWKDHRPATETPVATGGKHKTRTGPDVFRFESSGKFVIQGLAGWHEVPDAEIWYPG